MPLIRHGAIAEDRFVQVTDDAVIAGDTAVIVPAARLLADADRLMGRGGLLGVVWPNDRPVAAIAPFLHRLALIALVFPNFRDGRAYSQARILRERYHFRRELRATGQVLRDQFLLLHRAGFDTFAVSKPADAAAFVEAIARYSVFYQPAGSDARSALRRRLAKIGADA